MMFGVSGLVAYFIGSVWYMHLQNQADLIKKQKYYSPEIIRIKIKEIQWTQKIPAFLLTGGMLAIGIFLVVLFSCAILTLQEVLQGLI
ncbi:MAG: hypothetical protein GXO48_00245 [Chlorobi bacterium]|nr:hypothetical protein [Chlorobiota bacterium]